MKTSKEVDRLKRCTRRAALAPIDCQVTWLYELFSPQLELGRIDCATKAVEHRSKRCSLEYARFVLLCEHF